MKISKLKIKNFKFFKQEEILNFNKSNVLIYGENGSGKSSIYWALYTLFQSSVKADADIQKYFKINGNESLLNKYTNSTDSSIELELFEYSGALKNHSLYSTVDGSMTISTNKNSEFKEFLLASDFINYKMLSKFYDFKNSEDLNIIDIFIDEIFKYITINYSFGGISFNDLDQLYAYLSTTKRPTKGRARLDFDNALAKFNLEINNLIGNINQSVNDYLENHFNEKSFRVSLRYEDTKYEKNHSNRYEFFIGKLQIQSWLKIPTGDIEILKPHTFFNEAKLTSIALSIRFSILEKRLATSPLKVLVLDDLLVSLDMSKRKQVLSILTNKFRDYQKIILTHDFPFYDFAKFYLSKTEDNKWQHFEMYENSYEFRPFIKEGNSLLEKAESYFNIHDYGASANYLRKECERVLNEFLEPRDLSDSIEISKKIIFSKELKKHIEATLITDDIRKNLEIVKNSAHRLVSINGQDFGPAYAKVNGFFAQLDTLLRERQTYIDKIDTLNLIRGSILNPQSHHDISSPIFKTELRDAIAIVKTVTNTLNIK